MRSTSGRASQSEASTALSPAALQTLPRPFPSYSDRPPGYSAFSTFVKAPAAARSALQLLADATRATLCSSHGPEAPERGFPRCVLNSPLARRLPFTAGWAIPLSTRWARGKGVGSSARVPRPRGRARPAPPRRRRRNKELPPRPPRRTKWRPRHKMAAKRRGPAREALPPRPTEPRASAATHSGFRTRSVSAMLTQWRRVEGTHRAPTREATGNGGQRPYTQDRQPRQVLARPRTAGRRRPLHRANVPWRPGTSGHPCLGPVPEARGLARAKEATAVRSPCFALPWLWLESWEQGDGGQL